MMPSLHSRVKVQVLRPSPLVNQNLISTRTEQVSVWLLPTIERDPAVVLRLPLPILCVLGLSSLSAVLRARLRKALADGSFEVALFFLRRLSSPSPTLRLNALTALGSCVNTKVSYVPFLEIPHL